MAQVLAQENELFRGAAAYDLYRGSAAAQPQFQPEELPRDNPQEQAQAQHRARPESHFITVVGCLAAACIMLLVLFSHQRLYAESDRVADLKRELSALQADQIQIRGAYDSAVDLVEIEKIATTRLGMSRPAAGQTVYLSLSGADRGEVLQKENDGLFAQFTEFVRGAFADLGAYLSQK